MRVTSLKEVIKIIREHIEDNELQFRLDGDTGRSLIVTVTKTSPVKNVYVIKAHTYDIRRSFTTSSTFIEPPLLYFSATTKVIIPEPEDQQHCFIPKKFLHAYVSGWNDLTPDERHALDKEVDAFYKNIVETKEFLVQKLEKAVFACGDSDPFNIKKRVREMAADECSRLTINTWLQNVLLPSDEPNYCVPSHAEQLALGLYLHSMEDSLLHLIALTLVSSRIASTGIGSAPNVPEFASRLSHAANWSFFPHHACKSDALDRIRLGKPVMGINLSTGKLAGNKGSNCEFDLSPLELAQSLENPKFLEDASDRDPGKNAFSVAMGLYDAIQDALQWLLEKGDGSNLQYFRELRAALLSIPQSSTVDVFAFELGTRVARKEPYAVKTSLLLSAWNSGVSFTLSGNAAHAGYWKRSPEGKDIMVQDIVRLSGLPVWSRYPRSSYELNGARPSKLFHHAISKPLEKTMPFRLDGIVRIEHKGNVIFYSSPEI